MSEQTLQPQNDGWFQAGMQIAELLSLRPEVKASGLVGAVKEVLFALDRKLKSETVQDPKQADTIIELTEENEALKTELANARAKRDFVIGIALMIQEKLNSDGEYDAEMFDHIKSGVGQRKLNTCKAEAAAKINQ